MAAEAIEGMTARRNIPRTGVEEAEHVVERPVLEHEHDDVFDRTELIARCHGARLYRGIGRSTVECRRSPGRRFRP